MVKRALATLLAVGVVTALLVSSGLAKSSGPPKRLDQQVVDSVRTAITAAFRPEWADVTPSHLGEVQPVKGVPRSDVSIPFGVSSQSLQVKRGVLYVYAHDGTPSFGNTAEALIVEFANSRHALTVAKLLVRRLETLTGWGGPRQLTPVRKLGSFAYATRGPSGPVTSTGTNAPVVLFVEGKYLGIVEFINNSTPASLALHVAKAMDRGLVGAAGEGGGRPLI